MLVYYRGCLRNVEPSGTKNTNTAKIIFIRTNTGPKTGHAGQCQPKQRTLF